MKYGYGFRTKLSVLGRTTQPNPNASHASDKAWNAALDNSCGPSADRKLPFDGYDRVRQVMLDADTADDDQLMPKPSPSLTSDASDRSS
jgi:hypothetical protein